MSDRLPKGRGLFRGGKGGEMWDQREKQLAGAIKMLSGELMAWMSGDEWLAGRLKTFREDELGLEGQDLAVLVDGLRKRLEEERERRGIGIP